MSGVFFCFTHDPLHDDEEIKRIEQKQRARVAAVGSNLEVIAAAEGMSFDVAVKAGEKRSSTFPHLNAGRSSAAAF
jgi:hypothetical protein